MPTLTVKPGYACHLTETDKQQRVAPRIGVHQCQNVDPTLQKKLT